LFIKQRFIDSVEERNTQCIVAVREQGLCRAVLEGEGYGWRQDKRKVNTCLNGQGSIRGTTKLKTDLNEECLLRNGEIFWRDF